MGVVAGTPDGLGRGDSGYQEMPVGLTTPGVRTRLKTRLSS